MKLTFYGGVGEVTGSNYLLESGDTKVLIDCGLFQGNDFCQQCNFDPFAYDPKNIAAVFVTHAHIDHVGRIPRLVNQGFHGKIYSTPPTRDAAELLLVDSQHLLKTITDGTTLYGMSDVETTRQQWEGVAYHREIIIGSFRVTFRDAGHVIGSSTILIEAEGKKIIFSGDLGNTPAPLLKPTEPLPVVDYCVMEATYGDRNHEDIAERKERLEDVIEDTARRGGTLMIPAFAMERTQELIYEIHRLMDENRIPKIPIFVDSPLALKLTAVYERYIDYLDPSARTSVDSGRRLFNFSMLQTTLTKEESKMINDVKPPKVVIAGAGMSNGGRILHHELRYLPDPQSTILFIGYQSSGTLGRHIFDGVKKVSVLGEDVDVRCRIERISGYSAHADQSQLIDWLVGGRMSVKKVFLVHGEPDAARVLAQKIRDELALAVVIPQEEESVVL